MWKIKSDDRFIILDGDKVSCKYKRQKWNTLLFSNITIMISYIQLYKKKR